MCKRNEVHIVKYVKEMRLSEKGGVATSVLNNKRVILKYIN